MHKKYFIILLAAAGLFVPDMVQAQIDSTLFRRAESRDSLKNTMNMDAVYNRPMLSAGKLPVSVGGYMEANWQHIGEDGVSQGHQFQFRRFTIFMASTISKRIKFMSELEFENGTKEINIEFAALDMEFHPLLNLRGGIILNPIGAFNQNHDGPKWEFTDRPISATQMLPSTWSNAGFGLFGKHYSGNWMFGYEAYVSGGFDQSIINNEQGKTYLPATKSNADRFESSLTGQPLFSGKLAARNNRIGEIGISYMGGLYSRSVDNGNIVDNKRTLEVYAVDFNTTIPHLKTYVTGEWAWVMLKVPESYTQQYGDRQRGGFVDVIQPVLQRSILGWPNASLSLACRLEYVDWNVGRLRETGDSIGDDLWSVMGGLSFRPNSETVLRLNYRHQRSRDFFANPPVLLGGFSFGISTYF
ncbi:hypothetical protein ACR79B_07135 [Sphingobacterium spiritivorum]|uniref:hypothetical protein n=1 Tax=Sphingobacterium spiritivorum TaxID=258 RepID=UPI003DA23D0F